MDDLKQASTKTRRWMEQITTLTKRRIPRMEASNKDYWVTFKSYVTNRNFVIFNPQVNQIRMFTKLDISVDPSLQRTPSSNSYARLYPSIFVIKSEAMIPKVIELIMSSFELDSRLG